MTYGCYLDIAVWLASKLPATVSESTGEMTYDIYLVCQYNGPVWE